MGGGHTGILVKTGAAFNFIEVMNGVVSGTLDGEGGIVNVLNLYDTADISGSTVSNFQGLGFIPNATGG